MRLVDALAARESAHQRHKCIAEEYAAQDHPHGERRRIPPRRAQGQYDQDVAQVATADVTLSLIHI